MAIASTHSSFFRSRKLVVGVILLGLVLLLMFLFRSSINLLFNPKTGPAPINSQTKGEGAANITPSPSSNKSSGQASSSSPTTLNSPSGNFVSNHRPNLSGSPAPNQMQSVCITTPGAECQISFVKDGITKSLPRQKTDEAGTTYWGWKLQDIDLTEGSWEVKATAYLGDRTEVSTDALKLEVKP